MDHQTLTMEEAHLKKALLILNCLILAIGNCGGPMITRLYFIKGGKRVWFSSFLQSAGFPIIFIPLLISYFHRRKIQGAAATKLVLMNYQIFAATAVIGILTGLDNYLYAFGVSRLPVSTAAIVIASQLAFTAFFAFFLVNQKFSPFSVNAVVLLTFGSGILALDSGGDRPKEQSKMSYVLGFVMTLAAAALYGLVLPMIELMYIKAKQAITYTLVLEIQLVMCFFATVFCIVGMLINHDFQAIAREAKEYELGETKYNLVIIWSAIIWQLFFLGAIGVISCASSLVSGILMAVLLPVTQVLAVVFFGEKFQALKGVALVLSLWGFASYFYGEIRHNKKSKINEDERIIETTPFHATKMVHVTQNLTIVDP